MGRWSWGKSKAVATRCAPGRRPAPWSARPDCGAARGVRSARARQRRWRLRWVRRSARAARPSSAAAAARALVVGDDHRQRGRADAATLPGAPPPAPSCRSWREEGGEVARSSVMRVSVSPAAASRKAARLGLCRGGGDLDRTAKTPAARAASRSLNSDTLAASVPPMKMPMLRTASCTAQRGAVA